MEQKLHIFLQSGLLEKYVIGSTTPNENLEVEHFISCYPEVEAEYNSLQTNLEIMAKANAIEAPKFILDDILNSIEEQIAPSEKKQVIQLPQQRSRTPWYSIAASAAAIIFAVTAFMLFQYNKDLVRENQVVVEEIFDLRSDIEKNNSKLDDVMRQFMKLNNPETEKYVLRGNARAKNLKTVAYINAVDKTSMIDVVELPQLPENQTYQIWAELQDKMVNLGILDASSKKLQSIPYMEDALGLSITIEPKNSISNRATAENEVAEISLKSNQ
ncbi:anti-sigma-K factor rskA [Flavobacteriaceae bacterium MAR_2010_72]|nr:anti-sigma-K factor rskA [Flavobacteriaceae bacterium MAR_2010_72]TVZ57714.1 anti-sigma-K factor rskA [Flavobacteriaceae bacterium MAR_2010_105]